MVNNNLLRREMKNLKRMKKVQWKLKDQNLQQC